MPAHPSIDRTPEGWDGAAESYAPLIAPLLSPYAEDALRRARVGAGMRFLDVACGTGAAALAAARLGADVTATDFSPSMAAVTAKRAADEGLRVRVEIMDGQALDLPDDHFDVACSMFGLIFFPDRGAGFRELRRVLVPGGTAIVGSWSSPERTEGVSIFSAALRRAIPDLPPPAAPPAVYSLQDPGRLRAEMEAAGFAHVRVGQCTHPWQFAGKDAVWGLVPGSPVFAAMLDSLGDRITLVRRALAEMLDERFGDGPISFDCEAHIGIGRA